MRATTKTRTASDDDTRGDEDEEAPSFDTILVRYQYDFRD